MIQYNPKDWFTFIFRVHKADTFRALFPMIIGMSVYTAVVVWLEVKFQVGDNVHVKNINQMHSLLGFAISMLLVFRTNTAYDRWWEGRRLWGSLVNGSRNLALKLHSYLPPESKDLRHDIANYIGAFSQSLHLHLRKEEIKLELADYEGNRVAIHTDSGLHIPAHLTSLILSSINTSYLEKKISNEQFLSLNTETTIFMDVCGACERIKNTPIPFSYSVFIKKIIFFYTMTLPFGFAFSLGYIAIPVTVFIFYVLASLEIIAEEIEDPFSGDSNDLPTKRIADTIEKQCKEILNPVS